MKLPDSSTETAPSNGESISPEEMKSNPKMAVEQIESEGNETKDHPEDHNDKEKTKESVDSSESNSGTDKEEIKQESVDSSESNNGTDKEEIKKESVDSSESNNGTDKEEIKKESVDSSESNNGIDKQEIKEESITQEHDLGTKDGAVEPLQNKTTDSEDKPNFQTGLIVEAVDEETRAKTEILSENSKDISDKISTSDISEDKSSLPEVDSHIKELNSIKSNGSSDDVDSSVSIKPHSALELKDILKNPEAYINEGFVSDGVSFKPSEVDVVPVKSVSPDPSAGHGKLPRRVSFSDTPSKAVYDNLGCVRDSKTGDNGAAQGEEDIDFLAKYGPGEKWRILRNVVLISAAFMVLFTSFFGAANLQSSVNAKAGLGTVSLTMLYGALIVSNIFLPVMVIRWLRCKWTVALGALGFAPYAIAQFHAEFYTLIPTAFLAGLGAAPMWCAKCTYLNVAADAFAKVTGSPPELVMVRFFGIFYVLFPLGHVWGNLISSEVLSRGVEEESRNVTIDVAALCGANYCPGLGEADNPNLQRPPDYQINTIAGIFVACSLLAVLLVAVGVDSLSRYNEGGRKDSGTGLSGLQLLIATAKLLCDRNQLVLIPITAFIGISQAFLGADFTEGYISCAWGIPHIGYVLIGYGLASSIASVFVSWVVKTAGRLVVISSSITLFLILVTVLKFWQPTASQGAVYFILAALWGLADSTAMVINAMYGLLFRGNEAAAYSNFSLWGSAGFIVTYSYSPHLCMNTKLAILAVVLILALAGFVTAELALRRIIREQEERDNNKTLVTGEPQVS